LLQNTEKTAKIAIESYYSFFSGFLKSYNLLISKKFSNNISTLPPPPPNHKFFSFLVVSKMSQKSLMLSLIQRMWKTFCWNFTFVRVLAAFWRKQTSLLFRAPRLAEKKSNDDNPEQSQSYN
jgi:hypothetical protein